MLNVLIIIVAINLLIGLLYCENKEKRKGLLLIKTLLSSLFVFTLLVQNHPILSYFYSLMAGLILCLGGDVFLALPQKRMFLFGLVSFLLGHVFYIYSFLSVSQTNHWTWVGSLIVLVISGYVYIWLRPHLGSMNVPVLLYVVVIAAMVSGALSVLGDPNLKILGRIMVFTGALSFYFSDLFVARDRFLNSEFFNRLIGLPMYYTGQFLIAFSVGLLKY